MNKEFFDNKRVVILGLARQGRALAQFLVGCGAKVVVSDLHHADELLLELNALRSLPIEYVLGEHPLSLLDGCELLALSGGVPPQIPIVQEAISRGIALTNDSLITMQMARAANLGPILAITGSSGKTTTTTLVGEMLGEHYPAVHVGGNIGSPLIDRLDQINPGEPIVLELSSFQLELFNPTTAEMSLDGIGPDVAAILNITPNHLDRHPDMAHYASAKFNLLRYLPSSACVVLSGDDPVTATLGAATTKSRSSVHPSIPTEWKVTPLVDDIAEQLQDAGHERLLFSYNIGQHGATGVRAWFDGEDLMLDGKKLCCRHSLQLRGDHNVNNVLAAAIISKAAGATTDAIHRAATQFTGVAHRLEIVAERNGVVWINDSIATSPERALAGLRSFDVKDQAVILLAGGKDKNLSWQTLADEVLTNVSYLIGFGAYGPEFVRMVQERGGFGKQSVPSSATAKHLDQAIELAARLVDSERAANPEGEVIVLLSPGGTSYDAYKDFEERGEHFRNLVTALGN